MSEYYLPAQYGSEDLAIDALVNLLTDKCQYEVATGDLTRAVTVKAGYLQANPGAVNIMIYENDPDDPKQNTHRPMRDKVTGARHRVGGGSLYSRAFLIEVLVQGSSMPTNITRAESRRIASIVVRRVMRALLYAGPKMGQGGEITDSFGETYVNGPFFGRSWADNNEGESKIVRKYIQVWYITSWDWDTDGW